MVSYFLNSSRLTKRIAFFCADILTVMIALYAAFALRYGEIDARSEIGDSWILFPLMLVFGAATISFFRLPRIKLNAFENRALLQVGFTALSLIAIAIVTSYTLSLSAPRSVPAVFGTLFFLFTALGRIGLLYLIRYLEGSSQEISNVIIYGAGAAGIQIASALRQAREARPVAFIDDNSTLHGLMIAGLQVFPAAQLERLASRFEVDKILVAIPSLSSERRKAILANLESLETQVLVLPSYVDLMEGNYSIDKFEPLSPDQLLGRDKIELDAPEIENAYAGRVVMVTGAGGSIGSEICTQLVNCSPSSIVLFEQSEFQLYAIEREIRRLTETTEIKVKSRLGSVTDKSRITTVIEEMGVEIILHAAAYKHVPIVEENELEGVRNNVIGTKIVAEAANAAGLERMILVSTDKAVRPTNIMGATKRMAELVVQDMQTRSTGTKFAMVRFGNVLGSSGSVLPLFQSQIAMGGPVTVTHPEVTRFFMTIPEAARLVLLAGAYASGGDVFVLDMGKPQKIMDIAKRMIELAGKSVQDPNTGEGDIKIEITGLRPGEKLYEELLIDDDSLIGTPHPKILRAEETILSEQEVSEMLEEAVGFISANDVPGIRNTISTRIAGYHKQPKESF